MKITCWCQIVLVAFLFIGCDQSKRDTPLTQKTSAVVKTQSEVNVRDAIVVRINGRDITRSATLRKAKAILTLNMNKKRQTKVGRREWEYFTRYIQNTANREIRREAIQIFLREEDLQPSSNMVRLAKRNFEQTYGVYSRKLKRRHRIDDLKYMLGNDAWVVDTELKDYAGYIAATNAMISRAVIVATPEEIEKRIQDINAFNERAAATNALVFARATNVWHKVLANTNQFESIARKYSEDVYIDQGSEWGMFTKDQLADEEEIRKILPNLKIGDITPPIESDGGLAILRLDPSENPENVTFSRIFFRLPIFYDQEVPEESARVIVQEKSRKLINDTVTEIISKMRIEYPDGPNIFLKDGKPIAITSAEFKAIGQ